MLAVAGAHTCLPFILALLPAGPPLAVSLLAPLWVVNATPLAVDAVIVPLDAPPLQAQPSGKAGGLVPRRRAAEGFRCGEVQGSGLHVVWRGHAASASPPVSTALP